MSDHWGTAEQPSTPPPSIGSEHGYLILAAMAGSLAALLGTLDQTTDEDFPLSVYILLATLFLVGGCGWLVRSEGAQRRRDSAEVRELLAELTQGRRRPAAPCRPGATHLSQAASQGDSVGIRAGTVDAAADSPGVTLQRAREDGIEEGFEIGYRAQLADLGVTPLPRPRRPRLTGDS